MALTATTLHPRVLARQAAARADVMAPPRAGLEPITFPPLDGLEPAVASHLREARSELERAAATAQRGDLARAYGAFGRILHAYEFFAAAEAAYLNAARLAPGESDWPHLLGFLYQQTGRLEEAAVSLGAARRARSGAGALAVRLGDVYVALDRLRDAREQYESVLTTLPAAAHQGLGEVALRERRYREALEHFRAALDRVPQATALHYSIAMAYRGLGRLDDARAHLAQRGTGGIVAADPVVDSLPSLVRGERLLVIRGNRFYAAGRYQEAADAFERALAVAPSSVPAHVNLASALVQLGDMPRAIDQMQSAYARSPDEVEEQVVALALQLSEHERYGDAIALLSGAERRVPGRAATATMLARLLASSPELARRNGARALELAMAVEGNEPRPAHAETVALALAELGRCSEAAEWMRRAAATAEATGDAAEVSRLRAELPRFEAPPCRAPGR